MGDTVPVQMKTKDIMERTMGPEEAYVATYVRLMAEAAQRRLDALMPSRMLTYAADGVHDILMLKATLEEACSEVTELSKDPAAKGMDDVSLLYSSKGKGRTAKLAVAQRKLATLCDNIFKLPEDE